MTEPNRQEKAKSQIRESIKDFPTESGVYLMKNGVGKIIYIGKAKNLRSRVRSYYGNGDDQPPKTIFLVRQIKTIEYVITKTEVEAFLLEASLIKKHRPRYNIRLRDDKSYPYIRISMKDSFPRLYVARRVKNDGAYYFGPYTSGRAVQETIRLLNQTYNLRDCTDSFMKARKRPCITYQIGRCTAPCVKYIDQTAYGIDVRDAIRFLQGRNQHAVRGLKEKMKKAAESEQFEWAGKLRDTINAIQNILEKQNVVSTDLTKDQDAIGFFGDDRGTLIETLHVRGGRVIGNRPHFLPLLDSASGGEDVRDWLVSFITQYYLENYIPDELLLPVEIGGDLTKLLAAVFKERSNKKVNIRLGVRESDRKLLEMADTNAKSHFERHVNHSRVKTEALECIHKRLKLPRLPQRIECFDISHFQGRETVASQVVFVEGVPNKDEYRRYKLRTVSGGDDYQAMHEVLSRRFQHVEYEDPDLLVVDGGKGQLNIALKVLKEISKQEIPTVGLAKARVKPDFSSPDVVSSQERVFIKNQKNYITFPAHSEALHILCGIRDEAHRFAIGYHRRLRESTSLESELDEVMGLGETRKKILLEKYDSVESIRQASVEELARITGFSRGLVERVLQQLNEGFTPNNRSAGT